MKIGNRIISDGKPVYIIAEAGINHNGNISLAKKLIDKAVWAGADAVKFQSFRADSLVSRRDKSFKRIKKLELARQAHIVLSKYSKKAGITFLSSAFDEDMVDFLDSLGIPAHKIASCELTNLPFVTYVAKKNKPMFVSTGLSSCAEIEDAVKVIRATGNNNFVILHCIAVYPAKPEIINLRTLNFLKDMFKVPVGFSDHTMTTSISIAAVGMGACVVERHFTLDRNLPGFDQKASLEPQELKELIKGIRDVEKSMGSYGRFISADEKAMAKIMRKSIIAETDIRRGEIITPGMVSIKRPGTGILPKYINFIIGKKAEKNIFVGSIIKSKDVKN